MTWGQRPATHEKIVLVISDHTTRVLLNAELLGHGYDVVAVRSFGEALMGPPVEPERGPVRLIIIDDEPCISAEDGPLLDVLVARYHPASFLLLASGIRPVPPGPWQTVVRRPVSIGELATVVDQTLSYAREERLKPAARPFRPGKFTIREGPPWPRIRCHGCGLSRHYEPFRTRQERHEIRDDFHHFMLEHSGCA